MTEREAMQRALELALRGTGHVSPNPRVGCVLLKDGHIIGQGWHERYGDMHAEAAAIAQTTADVEGATLVVNLEPCSHEGKQPPCASLIIEKKIARVVIGMEDPNPLVAGRGIAMLREAGIEVQTGVLEEECRWVNRFFRKHIAEKTPYVIAKIGQSLDGCISTARGESRWITSEESRRRAHALRAEVDGVLIGRATALADDPELTVRAVKGRNPKRIVLDTHLSLPLTMKLFSDPLRSNTILCCSKRAASSRKADTLRVAGVNVAGIEESTENKINIANALDLLAAEYSIASIMVEGGSQVLSSFMQRDMIDEFHIFAAPFFIGDGRHSLSTLYTPTLRDARRFRFKAVSASGGDMHIISVRDHGEQ